MTLQRKDESGMEAYNVRHESMIEDTNQSPHRNILHIIMVDSLNREFDRVNQWKGHLSKIAHPICEIPVHIITSEETVQRSEYYIVPRGNVSCARILSCGERLIPACGHSTGVDGNEGIFAIDK